LARPMTSAEAIGRVDDQIAAMVEVAPVSARRFVALTGTQQAALMPANAGLSG